MPVDAGLFIGGALAVSVSPTDANHLLYATDSRLLRSPPAGGRDWKQEAADKRSVRPWQLLSIRRAKVR
jgi:hypothetical protein